MQIKSAGNRRKYRDMPGFFAGIEMVEFWRYRVRRMMFNRERAHRHPATMSRARRSKLRRN